MSYRITASTHFLDYGDISQDIIGGGNSFTLSVWVIPENDLDRDQYIISKTNSAGEGFSLFVDDIVGSDTNRIRFVVNNGVSTRDIYTSSDFNFTDWVHILVTYDVTTGLRMYENGVETTNSVNGTSHISVLNVSESLLIGSSDQDNSLWLGGIVHHFVFWDQIITTHNIEYLADGADPRTIQPQDLTFFAWLDRYSLDDPIDAYADLVNGITPYQIDGNNNPIDDPTFLITTTPSVYYKSLVIILGHTQTTSVKILTNVGRTALHQIEYSTGSLDDSPATTTATFSEIINGYGVVHTIENLSSNTAYNYRLLIDGEIVLNGDGIFTTAPDGEAQFSVIVGSCSRFASGSGRLNRDLFKRIEAQNSTIHFNLGDTSYNDSFGWDAWSAATTSGDPSPFWAKYHESFGDYLYAQILKNISTYFIQDDHEWTDNFDADDKNSFPIQYQNGLAAVNDFHRSHGPPGRASSGSDGTWYSFSYGNVDFFMADSRTQRDSNNAIDDYNKTYLGEEQKQDLFEWLASSTGAFRIICIAGPLNPLTGTQDSLAVDFVTEGSEIISEISQYKNVQIFTGDNHRADISRLNDTGFSDQYDNYEFQVSPIASGPHLNIVSDPDVLLNLSTSGGANPDYLFYQFTDIDTTEDPPTMNIKVYSLETDSTENEEFTPYNESLGFLRYDLSGYLDINGTSLGVPLLGIKSNTIRQIVTGTGSTTADASTEDINITADGGSEILNLDKTFYFISYKHSAADDSQDIFKSSALINSTTIRIYGDEATASGNVSVDYEYFLVEMTSDSAIIVQSSVLGLSSPSATETQIISSVVPATTIIIPHGHSHNEPDPGEVSTGIN